MNQKEAYPSDLKDHEWEILEPMIHRLTRNFDGRGRKSSYNLRDLYNGMMYICREGSSWRGLPKDYPPYSVVFYHFSKWTRLGIFKKLNKRFRRALRKQAKKQEKASIIVVDAQSVRAGPIIGNGVDGHKCVKGRKRHILVDSLGLLMHIIISPANQSDRQGLRQLMRSLDKQEDQLIKVLADAGYESKTLTKELEESYQVALETMIREADEKGFVVKPHRWKVERAFAWLGWFRRLNKIYDQDASHEAFCYFATAQHMLKRLARTSTAWK